MKPEIAGFLRGWPGTTYRGLATHPPSLASSISHQLGSGRGIYGWLGARTKLKAEAVLAGRCLAPSHLGMSMVDQPSRSQVPGAWHRPLLSTHLEAVSIQTPGASKRQWSSSGFKKKNHSPQESKSMNSGPLY